ncbi:Wadjet anti-phage system protein JetD domain-containing protein [Tepidibacter sp. Z1-5]|uniref:Wadjet anti-phage system protein JetD domain-containing protein n=1 Tax=Tepidibacter sp. Z1-5 TaxID=3134138 RepID=UPI0030BBD9DC
MNEKILSFLRLCKKTTISLNDFENLFSGSISYEEFAKEVLEFEEKDIIREVKKHKRNNKPISLANTYRINKSFFKEKLINEIQEFQLYAHPKIQLKTYLSLDELQWENDLKYIIKVDNYLKENGFPFETVTPPERSFQISGDEKWIDEKGGKKILERIEVWDGLKISSVPDPLMISVNPSNFSKPEHIHLIVENKATYYAILEVLEETNLTSLIYGCGWKILSGIHMLEKQLSLQKHKHKLYYFGDLDFEGISIWNGLNEKRYVNLAVDFYKCLLKKDCSKGKENQQKNEEAICNFIKFFDKQEQEKIIFILENKGYYPQEALTKEEVQHIWRKGIWI